VRRRLAAALVLALAAGTAGATPSTDSAPHATTLHALQRLTYGPRPGDVERVEAMGLTAWLERQLDPFRCAGRNEHAIG